MTDADCSLFVMSPAGGGKGVDVFEVDVILISYTLALLSPPPSLRDTSASGGHRRYNVRETAKQKKPEGWCAFRFFVFLLPGGETLSPGQVKGY